MDDMEATKTELSMEENQRHEPVLLVHEYHRGDDEAFKVLGHLGKGVAPITDAESKVVLRKIDFILMPVIYFIVALQFVDKAALGSAALFGIVQELNLFTIVSLHPTVTNTARYSDVTMIYQVGFLVGVFPLAALAQKLPTGKTCAVYVFLWGLICLLTTQCKDYPSLMVQRFFLGFVESGVSPTFLRVISMWYKQSEHAMRAIILNSATAIVVPPICGIIYGIVRVGSPAHSWANIYWLVGGVTMLASVLVWVFVPDSPATGWWLSERQKYIAVERIRSNQAGMNNKTFKWKQALSIFKDPKCILLFIIVFCVTAPSSATASFSGLVIQADYGADKYKTLLLQMPIGAVSFVCSILAGLVTSRIAHSRAVVASFLCCLVVVGCAMCWKAPRSERGALLAGVYLIAPSSGAYGTIQSLAVSNTGGASKKTAITSLIWVAFAVSNIAAPYYYKKTEYPAYPTAFATSMGLLAATVVLLALYSSMCWRDNTARSKLPASEVDHAFDDMTDIENKAFRYQY